MKKVNFTPEQQEALKNCYLITGNQMIALGGAKELSKENFRAFWVQHFSCTLQELTVDDFEWDNPYEDEKYDFIFSSYGDRVSRDEIPEEVVELLDTAIQERLTNT